MSRASCNSDEIVQTMKQVDFAPFLMFANKDVFDKMGQVNVMASTSPLQGKSCPDLGYGDLLRDTFFSDENMRIINNRIIVRVYDKTKVRVQPLKYEHLAQAMNLIYGKFCRNLPYRLQEQIDELDNRVADMLAKLVMEQMAHQKAYMDFIDVEKRGILPAPVYVSSAGSRTLPSTMGIVNR